METSLCHRCGYPVDGNTSGMCDVCDRVMHGKVTGRHTMDPDAVLANTLDKPLTKVQLKKLLKGNDIQMGSAEGTCTQAVISGSGLKWSLEVFDESVKDKIIALLPDVDGYTTGYGSLVLSPGYKSKGDFNDRTSAWHY